MGGFIKEDVVVVPFPFSDLTQAKRRPALVVAVLKGDDVILCQITSQNVRDEYSLALSDEDFKKDHLTEKAIYGRTGFSRLIAILYSTGQVVLKIQSSVKLLKRLLE